MAPEAFVVPAPLKSLIFEVPVPERLNVPSFVSFVSSTLAPKMPVLETVSVPVFVSFLSPELVSVPLDTLIVPAFELSSVKSRVPPLTVTLPPELTVRTLTVFTPELMFG